MSCLLLMKVLDITANLAEQLPGCVLQLTSLRELHAGMLDSDRHLQDAYQYHATAHMSCCSAELSMASKAQHGQLMQMAQATSN